MNTPTCCKCGKTGQLFVTSDGKAYCDVCFGRIDKARPERKGVKPRPGPEQHTEWKELGGA
jgi:hypothetical protein